MSQPVITPGPRPPGGGQWPFPPGDPLPLPFGPLLLVVLPNSGPAAGGDSVQLLGLGIGSATSVLFGTTPGTIVVGSGDPLGLTLTVIAPAHVAGTVPVTVVTSSGTSNPVSYTYAASTTAPAPPTAVSINPLSGPIAGGTPFVITGTNLTGATVTVNGVLATVLGTNPTGTLLFGTVPAGAAAGNVPVVVTTASGAATVLGGYTYTA